MKNSNGEQLYVVLDKTYTIEEGQDCLRGTLEECQDFVSSQSDYFMYEIVPDITN